MSRIEPETPFVTRITKCVIEQPIFTLDLKKNVLKVVTYDGHIEIKQADIAALLDFLQPFDYPLQKQTFFTYFPMPLARLTASELVGASHEASEEMVALDVCICNMAGDFPLGEIRAEALYFKESHRFGIMCHDYGYTHWLKGRSLEAAVQFFVDTTWWLSRPPTPPIPGWEHLH